MIVNPQFSELPLIRCSSLDQLLGCHASRQLRLVALAKMPELATAFDDEGITKSGSWTHYRAALRLVMDHDAVGEPEMPAGAEPMADKFEQWVEQFYIDTVIDNTSPDFAIAVEQRITVQFARFILSGQIDCFTINAEATEAEINDLKTGYREVDAAEYNWQLYGYLVLLLRRFPGLKKIRLRIIQPRNEPDKRISTAELEVTAGLEAFLIAEIEKALDNQDDLETGRKQCRWCIAQLICPALKLLRRQMKMKLTKAAIAEIKETPNDVLLGEWVVDGQMLTAPIKSARELIKERIVASGQAIMLDDGTTISVETTNGQRKVTDVAYAKQRLDEQGIPFMECVSVSVPKVEELAAKVKKLPKTSKDPAKETAATWIEKNFSDCYEQPKQKELVIT